MSAWIEMVNDDVASPELMDALSLARTPHGTVDNAVSYTHLTLPTTPYV